MSPIGAWLFSGHGLGGSDVIDMPPTENQMVYMGRGQMVEGRGRDRRGHKEGGGIPAPPLVSCSPAMTKPPSSSASRADWGGVGGGDRLRPEDPPAGRQEPGMDTTTSGDQTRPLGGRPGISCFLFLSHSPTGVVLCWPHPLGQASSCP